VTDIEFVSVDEQGIEHDWIDPVLSVEETETAFAVDNGCYVYEVLKQKGWKYVQRVKEVA
jgi:hypothetical protein